MRKDKELFAFFRKRCPFTSSSLFAYGGADIDNPISFKTTMQTDIAPLITSTALLLSPQFESPHCINLAFSATGLNAIGVTEDLSDSAFTGGQFADASNLVSTPRQDHCVTNATLGRPGNRQLGRSLQRQQCPWRLPHRQVTASITEAITQADKRLATIGQRLMTHSPNSSIHLQLRSPSFTNYGVKLVKEHKPATNTSAIWTALLSQP